MSVVEEYRKRRATRLLKRGFHADAGKNNNNQEEEGGSRGNTRLPYGIAKSRGLDTTGMTPREVWEMLIGEGVSPKEEYAKLGKKEEEPPPPPPKKTTIKDRYGYECSDLRVMKSWKDTYTLYGKREGWDRSTYLDSYDTKEDLLWKLKEDGLEEITIDGETVNPKEMELPAYVYLDSGGKHYSKVAVGFRGGKFVALGTGMDGKSTKITEAGSLDGVLDWFDGKMDTKDLSVTKGAKKAEEERTGWLTAASKEYYVSKTSGERVGHLSLSDDYRPVLVGETESGRKITRTFASKADAMYFLKSEGVEKVTVGKGRSAEKVNPTEETFDGEYYGISSLSGMYYVKDLKMAYSPPDPHAYIHRGRYELTGVGLDGSEKLIDTESSLDRLRDYVSTRNLSVTEDESVGKAAEIEAEAKRKREEERKRKEEERLERERIEREKKEAFARKEKEALKDKSYHLYSGDGHVYKDVEIKEETDWSGTKYVVTGADVDGNRTELFRFRDMDTVLDRVEEFVGEDYKVKGEDGAEKAMPTYGMRKVSIEAKTGGGFVVYADTKRFGKHEIMYEAPSEKECRDWLTKNNVDQSKVKVKTPVPNDDVVRTHVASSLKRFDEMRRKGIETSVVGDMTSQQREDATAMMTEIFSKGSYSMMRSVKSFDKILDGGFLSQVETHTGGVGACVSPSTRRGASKQFFGISTSTDAHEYEKYGYLGTENDEDDDHPFYGTVRYTFKKDRVKDRVTFTMGDSLNTRHNSGMTPGYAGDSPTIEGFSSLYSKTAVKRVLDNWKKYKEGSMTYKEMFNAVRRECNNDYVEVQFHGELTMQDVESVIFSQSDFRRAFSNIPENKRREKLNMLRGYGVKLLVKSGSKYLDGYEEFEKMFAAAT